jgi:hypothetical protein
LKGMRGQAAESSSGAHSGNAFIFTASFIKAPSQS